MINQISLNTKNFKRSHDKTSRKDIAQFFTSDAIAEFMAEKAAFPKDTLRILDPGSGSGILAAKVMEVCVKNTWCRKFYIDFVENDPEILPVLKETISILADFARYNKIDLTTCINTENFITEFTGSNYDIVICNPPYKKIPKDSTEAQAMLSFVHGQPNLYSLFMTKGLECLSEDGRYVFIVPRSWTSGKYYKVIRQYLLKNLNITNILIFEERDNVFAGENVLQETMILAGTKNSIQDENICIDISSGNLSEPLESFDAKASKVKEIGPEKYLLIPSSREDMKIISEMAGISDTFQSLGYQFKTGPVVEFRSSEYLSETSELGYVPMFRAANIKSGTFLFPIDCGKAQFLSEAATKLLLENKNTVLVKRLSSKEEHRRLQSCIYRENMCPSQNISIENHVNYLVRKDGKPLTESEINWIHNTLMSDEYDLYFRLINGSTQVNASELNMLPLRKQVK